MNNYRISSVYADAGPTAHWTHHEFTTDDEAFEQASARSDSACCNPVQKLVGDVWHAWSLETESWVETSPKVTRCACGHDATASGCTTGYGVTHDGFKRCFACCGDDDRKDMIETGKATLYLTRGADKSWKVTNWPGTASWPCSVSKGEHNLAGVRYDVRFIGPDKRVWAGTQYGDETQICRCRRLKH